MKRFIAISLGLVAAIVVNPLFADVVLTTGSLNSSDLDFDGGTLETDGSLGFSNKTFILTGSEIPAGAEFANVVSITLEFFAVSPFAANLSARSVGSEPGIGVFSDGENGEAIVGIDPIEEALFARVTTVSKDGKDVLFAGVELSNWQAGSSGALFGGPSPALINGSPEYSGASSSLIFDSGVSSFYLLGGDSIRLGGIRLAVSSVPEPGGMMLSVVVVGVVCAFRRRR